MIPVEQTILTPEEGGNCMAACLASLLELPIDAVPNAATEWAKGADPENTARGWELVDDFLKKHNLETVGFDPGGWTPSGYWLASVVSPRFAPRTHVVVCYGDRLVWDPHPEADPDATLEEHEIRLVYALITLDPARRS